MSNNGRFEESFAEEAGRELAHALAEAGYEIGKLLADLIWHVLSENKKRKE